MKATSCLEIFSLLIFNAATLGMILEETNTTLESCKEIVETNVYTQYQS